MTDRYQPGTSLLSFLNPRSMYYIDFGSSPEKLAETKAELVDALIDNKKDPTAVLDLTPNENAAVKEVVNEVKAELPPSIAPEEPAPAAAAEVAAPAPEPAAATIAETPAPETPAAVVAPAELPPAAPTAEVTPATVDAAANAAVVVGESAAVAEEAKAEVAAVADAVATETVAPGVEATGAEAATVAAAVEEAKAEGFCPCKLLALKRKASQTVGEQAKDAVEGFIARECFSVTDGPSSLISNIEVAGVNIKDILTGGNKPPAAKTNVETFCDNNWHGIASTIVVLLALVIMLILCLGVFGMLHVVFDIRKGPNPSFKYDNQ